MKYLVIDSYAENTDDALDDLCSVVEKFLALRWKPQGGISIVAHLSGVIVAQAITHDSDGPIPD